MFLPGTGRGTGAAGGGGERQLASVPNPSTTLRAVPVPFREKRA
jgi:hypothetical protein